MMTRPEKDEYADFYAKYVTLADGADIVAALQNQIGELKDLLGGISTEKENFRYAEGKWSVKELLGHLIDGERIFAYRAFRISRGDETPLAGFEENEYVAASNSDKAQFADLLEELALLRRANVIMFKNLTDEMWLRKGTASDAIISVRALAFAMVGHVRHHQNVLRERYLNQK